MAQWPRDDGGPRSCREALGGRNIIGDLAAIAPQAGRGGSEQGVTGDAYDGLDEGLPLGLGQDFPDRKYLDGAILLAGADCVAGRVGVGGSAFGGGGADDLKEARLVRLYLD